MTAPSERTAPVRDVILPGYEAEARSRPRT